MKRRQTGRHVAIDPYQLTTRTRQGTRFAGAGLRALEEAGVRDPVEFYPEKSQIVLPRLLGEGRCFDLAFLDGNHRFEGVFLDLIYSGRLLKDGGVIFVDDTQLPAVSRVVSVSPTSAGPSRTRDPKGARTTGWCCARARATCSQRPVSESVEPRSGDRSSSHAKTAGLRLLAASRGGWRTSDAGSARFRARRCAFGSHGIDARVSRAPS